MSRERAFKPPAEGQRVPARAPTASAAGEHAVAPRPPRAASVPHQLARVPVTAGVIQRHGAGLPEPLKAGIEHLSGHALDDVSVHYNSSEPATLNAAAYARGNTIVLGPGQERHLPHEAWHVVQQRQGRVKPTAQLKGNVHVNDDPGLEREADEMGRRALQHGTAQRAGGEPLR